MQNDSIQPSTSSHIQVTKKESSYKCSHCLLTFRSKLFLFEHLNKVHGYDVDMALTNAGLKRHDTNHTTDAGSQKCQHCDYISHNRETLKEHERCCQRDLDNVVKATVLSPPHVTVSPSAQNTACLTSQPNGDPKAQQVCEVECTSKNLKIYRRPPQTVGEPFMGTPGAKVKVPLDNEDGAKETLFLKDSPQSPSPNSRGVFKVTAINTQINVMKYSPCNFLHTDPLMMEKLKPMERTEHEKPAARNVTKRMQSESAEGSLPKRAKSDTKAADHSKVERQETEDSTSSANISFEVSDDEAQEKNVEDKALYFCKHCDYSDVDLGPMVAHYQDDHPYVRHNTAYIRDSADQSATFRCLQCPVEFTTTACLQRHYLERHPDGPDVFTVKSSKINKAFKCFLCSHITSTIIALKEHYKDAHPKLVVGDSLSYCRYLVTGKKKLSTQLNQDNTTSQQRKSGENSSESIILPAAEVKTSPQQPTLKGGDTTLYKCTNCAFIHKSVIVMHVHYQKSHPEEEITIDKIKLSARIGQQETSQNSNNSTNSVTTTHDMDFSEKKKVKTEVSNQNKIKVLIPKCEVEPLSIDLQRKKTKMVSVKKEKVTYRIKSVKEEMSLGHDLSASSLQHLFYCQCCSYTSPKARSVLAHHYSKHASEKLVVTMAEIVKHSSKMRKAKTKPENVQKSTLSFPSKTSESFEASSEMETLCEPDSQTKNRCEKPNPYRHVESLFYCIKCNFASPFTKGVLHHISKMHKGSIFSSEDIIQYSALVVKNIKKSKFLQKHIPSYSGLPLPLMLEGDEHRFFCHFCNYRHEEKSYITHHCKKSHGAKIQVETIEKYSAYVRKHEQKSHVKMTVKDDLSQPTVMKTIKMEENAESFPVSAPTLSGASQKERLFQCPDCTYNASYAYLFRRHLGQAHNVRVTASEILNNAFKKGLLQPGYHCEFCLFTHHDAVLFHRHYEQEHPKYFRSFKHVSTRLHVGATASLQKMKSKPKYQENGHGASNNRSLPWPVEHLYSTNPSKDGFRSTAKNKKHPLSSIEHFQSPTFGQKGTEKASHVFEPYQEPLDFDNLSNEAADPPTLFKCPYCSRVLKSEHNLIVHCKMKHYAAEQQKQVPVKKRVHVFKCLHCAYVHTKYQGVLSHCQKRHPQLKPRADSLHVDMINSQSSNDKEGEHGGPLVISGYMCKTCTVVFKKQDQFKDHCETAHVETMSTNNEPSKPSGTSNPTISKVHKSSQKLKKSKASLMYKYKFTKIKCPHCPFVCCSQPRLNRHLMAHHRNGNASCNETMVDSSGSSITFEGEKLLAYRCPKCSYVNTRHHGILTHCQMRHPKAKARAYNLKSMEIFLSNFVKLSLGKASNQNGYLCKFCQKIYPSSSKLKIHFMENHSKSNGSETWTEPESQPVTNLIQFPTSEADEGQNQQTDFPKTILPVPLQTTSKVYNCHMCSYTGLYRRYLQVHYRKTHKIDLDTTFKLLNKYNKVKKTKKLQSFSDPTEPEVKESTKCIKCPHLTLNSCKLLVDHYSTVHSLKDKTDFIIISTGEKKKTTGLYRCRHCFKQLNGIRKLCIHINNHRAELKDSFHRTIKPEPEPIELSMPGEVPSLEVGENFSQLITAAAEMDHPPTSVLQSPSELDDQGQPKIGGHLCELCGRTFLSMKGLMSHERSHAAVAGLRNLHDVLESSTIKPRVEKYLCYNAESGRPFACQICSYRTTTLGLWRRHFNRIHPDLVGTVDAYERTDHSPKSSEKLSSQDELDEEIEPAECSLYTEPPDVQRQLSHYNMVAQSAIQSRSVAQESKPPESTLFHCELCNFTSEHLSSVRRHYLNLHGRRIYRCKDCNYFSDSKETLEVHVKADHSAPHSERPHQKDFRCPFCLYQTRNKNYLIDHIVLHREERVTPIEINRPKLSRYLKGIIFRCHKCTFSCGDAETLGSHMSKHDDVRPYKCRLCFFDCAHLNHLEAHLGDKHQVLRNHELVGQVNLELLEARANRMPELDEERWLNGQENFDHPENGQCPELFTDGEESPRAQRPEKSPTSDRFTVQINGTDGKEEENGRSSVLKTHINEQMEQDAQKRTSASEVKILETTIKGMNFKLTEQEPHFNLKCTVLTKEAIEDIILLNEDGNKRSDTKGRENSPTETSCDAQVINGHTMTSTAVEKQRLPPDDAQLKMESEDDLDVAYSKIKREPTDNESEETERFREMPVLENEYLKEKRLLLQCKEEESEDDHVEQRKQKETSLIKESNGRESVGVSEDVELYICDFCGRNLESSADLKRHILRHGM